MKRKILQFLLRKLYLAPTDDSFIKINGGIITKNGKPLSKAQTDNYKAQANTLKEMELFNDLLKQLKYNATQSIYYKSQNIDDIIFGKVILYVIELIEKKINAI